MRQKLGASLLISVLLLCLSGPSVAAAALPEITSVSVNLGAQSISLYGSGFGSLAPFTGDGPYLSITDKADDGWGAGAPGDYVTVSVSEWTDSQINFWFAGDYTGEFGKFTVRPGDALQATLMNPQTGQSTTVAFTAPSNPPPPPVPNTPPTISLSPPQINGMAVTVNGTAAATTPGATISGLSWSWGDGTTTTGSFPQTHQYATSGSYTISVTATDSNGMSAAQSTGVSIVGSSSAPSHATPPALTLDSPQVSGLSVVINGSASPTTPGATLSNMSWSWGDGSYSNGFFPQSHQYNSPGNYTITVTTTDSAGASASQQAAVVVNAQQLSAPQPPPSSYTPPSPPAPSVLWRVPLTAGAEYLSIPCTLAGRYFPACRLDTASPLSAVLSPAQAKGLSIPDGENFSITSLTGSTPAYAGSGAIQLAGQSLNGYVTVDPTDSAPQPDLGLPTVRSLCADSIVIDELAGNLSCQTAPPSGSVSWTVPLASGLEYLSIPCTIDGQPFGSCRLDTASPLSAVLSSSQAHGLHVSNQESFQITSLTGATQAYAGAGSIELANHGLNGFVTVDASDTTSQPDLGLPTVSSLCMSQIVIDQVDGTLSCVG